ncbi:sugar ABC transporter ATP-binding protein [Lignipirellula cremea]|uniref:Ribose import ATP-binding protein RbsA n=1 Tax=Lignipirellula cremea TaxID=2528010 RepID=A0A518DZH9_9BACT|nr:sugar ABC transporter ATP-binding protein [Lignipirellula cremea]QDU97243.1 Ribose import ATP-binding protein RbsA [Lignipirellula cremea]
MTAASKSAASDSPPAPLLQMQGVSKRFGATQALSGVDLTLVGGQVMALIGENGAGKSTLMKVLSGAVAADAGQITIAGQPYVPRGPHSARMAGVAMIYQELTLAPDLSVEDNIMLGQERSRFGLLRRSQQRTEVLRALELLGHPELQPATLVGDLSVGAQQLVEIARALVIDAKVIVFDEPTSSLTAQDCRQLFNVIRKLQAAGIGVIYISHFLEEIREICQSFTVLRDGQIAGSGQVEGVTEEQIVSLMVGRDVDDLFPDTPHAPGDVVLKVRRLSGKRVPIDVDFDLRRGEILGVAGLVGAGRTEMLRAIFGLDPRRAGEVLLSGKPAGASPRQAIAAGLGFVSEDRKGEGLAQDRSLADNLTGSRLGPYSRFGWLNLRRRSEAVEHWLDKLQVKRHSQEQPISDLSGGNQQKVAIARILHQQAEVLLLDEPTRGIDVGAKSEIYRLMGQQAAAGKAIIFVSSYLPELLAISDSLAVIGRGRLREIRPTSAWTEEEVMACAVRSDDEV